MPPPSVRPARPVWVTIPDGTASAELLRLAIQLSEQHASLGPHRARTGIDTDSLHRPEVDDHAVVAD